MSAIVKTLEGIQCKSEGEKATLTMSIKADTASLVVPMLFGVRAFVDPQPPPIQPAQIAPPGALPPPVQVVK